MKRALFTILATAAALSVTTASAETVQIANAADWATFANRVNAGETTLNAEMTANVMLVQNSPRVGTDGNPYGGAFDGLGHRLTLNWNLPGVDFAAPFAYVAGAAISNLHTMGSITTDRHFTSGLVGDVKLPGTTISGCRSSVAITSSFSGDITGGGFMSRTIQVVDTKIDNCLFDGSLVFANGHSIGGFVGYNEHDAAMKISNSLFAPHEVVLSSNYHCATFCRGYNNITVENSFYKQTIATPQGTDASSTSAQDLAAALGEKWTVSNGKAMLKVFEGPVVLSDGEIYTVAISETLEGEDGLSPINVAAEARAVINIKSGATLTVKGQDASGTASGTAAIYLPPSSTLYIVGDGTLVATGGAAANGGNGSDGGNASREWDGNKVTYLFLNGAGGDGGYGGGGAGAGIGGSGGGGVAAGSGAARSSSARRSGHSYGFPADGEAGGAGANGYNGSECGVVVILGNVSVTVTGGAAGASGSASRTWGSSVDEIAGDDWHAGGGSQGSNGKFAIDHWFYSSRAGGGGGGGGGAGGGGGSGSYVVVDNSETYFSTRIDGGHGGNGGGGTVGGGGGGGAAMSIGGGGEASEEHANYNEPSHATSYSGAGGDGGNGGNQGGTGSLYALSSASLTLSPSCTAAQPTAYQRAEDAPAAPVTVAFESDGASVDTAQATLMLAPPSAPAPAAKANYAFQGYYTAGGTQIYDADCNPVYPVWQTVEDVTLYARWSLTNVNFTFVSGGTTAGTANYQVGSTASEAPIATRRGNDIFLGYFTEQSGGEMVYDENYEFALADTSILTDPNTTLYAHWKVVPTKLEGGITRLVYRGVLTNFGEWSSGLRKTMHVKVYDSASATTALWSGDAADVPINPDGSFEAVFGNDELALAFASNDVTHVELTVGDALSPLAPRRAFASVASVNRALVAEGAASDIKVGTLGANALIAEKITAGTLEASETVRVEGSVSVEVKPFDIEHGRETTIWRGAGVSAWGESRHIQDFDNVVAGQFLWTADSDGVVMIHCSGSMRSTLRIPATIQFVRPGDEVRAPTYENGKVSVTFWGYKR